MKNVMIVLILGIAGLGVQNAMLYKAQADLDINQVVIEKNQVELQEVIEDHLNSIYTLMKSGNARLYTIMDTQIRIFHYAKPHKEPVWACTECAEIHDSVETNDMITISRDQYKRLIEYEKADKENK